MSKENRISRDSCRGCKYLFAYGGRGFCREAVLPAEYIIDQTSGIGGYHERLKYGLSWRSNSTSKMTEYGMPCGPSRLLYDPRFSIKIITNLSRLFFK